MKASKNLYVRLSRAIGSLVLVFIMSNILLVEETKAQCPPGYSTTVVAMTVGSCDYNVEVCYICPPQGIIGGSITLAEFYLQSSSCQQSLSTEQVLESITSQLATFYYINIICPNPIPPCDEVDIREYELLIPICWKKRNDNGEIKYVVCDNSPYCSFTIKSCRDVKLGKLISHKYLNGLLGTMFCEEYEPDDPDLNIETNCFFIPTECYR